MLVESMRITPDNILSLSCEGDGEDVAWFVRLEGDTESAWHFDTEKVAVQVYSHIVSAFVAKQLMEILDDD